MIDPKDLLARLNARTEEERDADIEAGKILGQYVYFDRKNRPLALFEWANLRDDKAYCIFCTTEWEDDLGKHRVVTAWNGVREPLIGDEIFGTGYLHDGQFVDELEQYPTEELAREGHARHVAARKTC